MELEILEIQSQILRFSFGKYIFFMNRNKINIFFSSQEDFYENTQKEHKKHTYENHKKIRIRLSLVLIVFVAVVVVVHFHLLLLLL